MNALLLRPVGELSIAISLSVCAISQEAQLSLTKCAKASSEVEIRALF